MTPNEQLLKAAAQGNLDEVKAALAAGADVNGRDAYNNTALNEAAEYGHTEIVTHLLAAGADIENLGGADKTPLMNAAFAGHMKVVGQLLDGGAQVSDDLLSSVQVKVNILKENTESGMVNPEAAQAWEGFLRYLATARLRQDLPQIVADLAAEETAARQNAADRIDRAVRRGIGISTAVPRLHQLTRDPDAETRTNVGSALTIHYVRARQWAAIGELFAASDEAVKLGGMSLLVSAAQEGLDFLGILPTIVSLLSAESLDIRHDAAITLGYAATNGLDVSSTIPDLTQRLADPEPDARTMAAWALYRIAKYVADIGTAVPSLQALQTDESQNVRDMAAEALQMWASKQEK